MVGAARRLATELVVIIARATQEIHVVAGALALAAAATAGGSTGTSAELTATTLQRLLVPYQQAVHETCAFSGLPTLSSPPRP